MASSSASLPPRYAGPTLDDVYIAPYLIQFTRELTIRIWKEHSILSSTTRELVANVPFKAAKFISRWNPTNAEFPFRFQRFEWSRNTFEILLTGYKMVISRDDGKEWKTRFLLVLNEEEFGEFKDWMETCVSLMEDYLDKHGLDDVPNLEFCGEDVCDCGTDHSEYDADDSDDGSEDDTVEEITRL